MNYRIRFSSWGWAELRALLLSPFGDYRQKLSGALSDLFPNSQVHVVNSARAVLKEVLRAASDERPGRDQVILPAYVCPSLLDSVSDLGLEVIRASVGDDLNLLVNSAARLISDRTLAVICVHMYGYPADILEMEKICKRKDVLLIDDAAQLGGPDSDGSLLGAHGDFGLISFAQSKSIVTGVNGSGGVLLVNSDKWKDIFSDFSKSLTKSRHSLWDILYFLGAYNYGHHLGKALYYLARIKSRLGFALAATDSYKLSSISNIEAGIALMQLKSYQFRVNKKREVLRYYAQILDNNPLVSIPQLQGNHYLTRVMMKLPDNMDVNAVQEILVNEGVHTRKGYPANNNLLEIPCDIGMSAGQAKEVCHIVSRVLYELSDKTQVPQ